MVALRVVGRCSQEARWFATSVDGVWVQAVHDGEELAGVFTWHDPSESPDPAWDEWKARVLAAMSPETPPQEAAGPGAAPTDGAVQADTAAAGAAPGIAPGDTTAAPPAPGLHAGPLRVGPRSPRQAP